MKSMIAVYEKHRHMKQLQLVAAAVVVVVVSVIIINSIVTKMADCLDCFRSC